MWAPPVPVWSGDGVRMMGVIGFVVEGSDERCERNESDERGVRVVREMRVM